MSNQEGHGLKYFFGEDNHFGNVTSFAARPFARTSCL